MSVFTIQIDYREKTPWLFEVARASGIPYRLVMRKVNSGDYTFVGGDNVIAVERKSMADFMKTMSLSLDGSGKQLRYRFSLEIARLQKIQESYIIVEAPLQRVLQIGTALKGQIAKLLLLRAILRMKRLYPRTRWIFAPNREEAQQVAFFVLHRAWNRARQPVRPGRPAEPSRADW